MDVFAHSAPGRAFHTWEPHREHAANVAATAAAFASDFGFAEAARAAGLLHDIGKCSAEFQAYIRGPDDAARGPDHSTAGAREARRLYPGPFGRVLSFIIAGHHAGLADGVDLEARLTKLLPDYGGWERETGPLPPPPALRPSLKPTSSKRRGFSDAFLTRMLFSCLVDADFLETERFYAKLEGQPVERDGFTPLALLRERLTTHMAALSAAGAAKPTRLNQLRTEILDHAIGKAGLPPNFFTLTVPTGGGKTLASLSFALEHALRHGLRRVIYVIPFTSIIEQTADVFRTALGEGSGSRNVHDILEHHASFDWEAAKHGERGERENGRGADPVDRLRRAAENWNAPVVVTTAVQFFESLFANRTARCRKLHNLARSVVILDEAQTLPLHLLSPCMAALDELQRNYGTSIVLCTATQPALRTQDGFDGGFDIDKDHELAPDPERLYEELKRFEVVRHTHAVIDAEIAARFAEQPQMLCIVNTREHAQSLFRLIKSLPGAVHLTTLMCPAHRRIVLAEARRRLKDGEPARIVSTSLIEAGVDIDLPEVWRAAAGLNSIIQAGGRCNREGKLPSLGRLVIFEPASGKAPPDLERAWQVGRSVLAGSLDPVGLDAVRDYFNELYFQNGPEALDAARLDGTIWPILRAITERARQTGERDPALAFPFASIARAFRIIDENMEPVVVPWSSGPDDKEAATVLDRIARMERPLGPDLRRLQPYVVAIPRKVRSEWVALGVLRPVHPMLGDALLRFKDLCHYDPATGVRIDDPGHRPADCNIW